MDKHQTTYLIYNPKAGRFQRGGQRILDHAVAALTDRGHKVALRATTGPLTATRIAEDCVARGARLVVAAGGDGTINEVLNGLAKTDVPLAVLPGGTANVLAVELGIGSNAKRAVRDLDTYVPARVALGCLRSKETAGRYFLLMAGIGLDAHIVYNIDAALKAKLGKLSYWLSGFGAVNARLPEFDVSTGGLQKRCGFALASRVRNYGGDIEIACNACLLESDFEIVLFEGSKGTDYLKYFAGVLTRRLASFKGVTVLRSERAEFSHPEDARVYVQVDGEYAGRLPAAIEIVPDALTLMVPKAYFEREKQRRKRSG